jgi:aromatic-L-amino-acid decarboxylase
MSDPEAKPPLSLSADEFRRLGHLVVDRIADYRKGLATRRVLCDVAPGDLLAALPIDPPEQPQGFEAVLDDLERLILPALTVAAAGNAIAGFESTRADTT